MNIVINGVEKKKTVQETNEVAGVNLSFIPV